MFELFGRPGWGSVIIEAQLVFFGLAHEFIEVGDLFDEPEAGKKILPLNKLAQIPTLILPDGTVMTESAAITLYLADLTGRDDFVPPPLAPERATFLRWLIYIVANIYPTYTYADDPARFVKTAGATEAFRGEVDAHAKRLYKILDDEAAGPWFLGSRFSALDVYICTLTHWRPGRQWFTENTPKLAGIAAKTSEIPQLIHVWTRNFPSAA
jgi:GST-like protein